MTCPRCGTDNPPERADCRSCGEPLGERSSQTAVTELDRGRPPADGTPAPATGRAGATPTEIGPAELTGSVLMPTSPSAGGTSGVASTGELILGTLFGNRYEILSILGQGGMGRVYKARDRELDKLIALKTIRLDTAEGPDALARFKQELLLARKVTHKNVVRIFDLGEAEGIKFFTMEYIEGDSLKAVIRRRGRVPVAEAIALSRQILSALEEAHSQGIVHRDLKPQNVMVAARTGSAHLMDFGIARVADGTSMTATGAIVGTPDYMSPEQVKGVRAGTASDVFSVGVILYEMLTGELPYQADTPMSKVMMRLSHRPRPVREISAEIPRYLERIVKRCLEIDPALRYQRAGDVLADLERESASTSFTLRLQQQVRRRRSLIVAAALVAAAAAASSWWLALRPRTRPAASAAPAGPVHTLAILPLTNATGSSELDWMREGLADMLVTDLSQSRYVRPVPGERVFRVLGELGAAERTRFDEATLEEVSKRAPAETVLHGQFVQAGDRLRLDLTLRRAGSGVPVPLKAEAQAADVFGLVDRVAAEVKRQLDLSDEQIKGDTARPFTDVATASVTSLRSYNEGIAAFRQGSVQAAIPKLREATAADPDFAMAWTRLAEAYLDAGEQREAEASVERARTLTEKTPLPLAQRYQVHAVAATVREDLETAARSYQDLAELYPGDPDLQYRLAGTLRNLGKQPEAIAAYRRVLELSPGYGAAEIDLARALWQAGRPEEAIRTLQATLAGGRFKDDAEALGTIHSVLGVTYRDTAQDEKALEHLKLSLEYRRKANDKRGQAVTLTNLASIYEEQGRIRDALAAEREALSIARQMRDRARESFVLNNMGLTYSAAGNLEKALAAFRESMQIEMELGDEADLANRLDKVADVYRRMGRYDDALVYLEQAKSHLEKADAKLEVAVNRHFLGLVYKARGQYKEALEAFLAAAAAFREVEQPVGAAMVESSLGGIYARQGRLADAWDAFQKAQAAYTKQEAGHDVAEVKAPMSRLAAWLGRTDEAARLADEAAKVAGGHSHGSGTEVEIALAQAEILGLRGRAADQAAALDQADALAARGGHRELGLEARVARARLLLGRGRATEAAALATAARGDAARLRLRPIEAEALAALASIQAARGRAEEARRSALDAISLAEKYEGRPVLVEARAALARALARLGRGAEATDAWARAASDLEWIRGSLKPEHVEAFMARRDVQAFLAESLARLTEAGRGSEAAALRPFLAAPTKAAAR
jgi:tetratricopeptide (TPR) repeat protein/predicted Ser/Thr protein kinase